MTVTMLWILPVAITTGNAASSSPQLTAMNPEQVPFGKPATVSLSLENLPDDAMLAVRPAGPFATHSLELPQPARLLAKHNDIVFTAAGGIIYRLDFSQPIAQILGTTPVNQTISALHTQSGLLLAATDTGDVFIYNIGTDGSLSLQHTIKLDASVTDLATAAAKVYVLTERRLLVYSMTSVQKANDRPLTDLALQSRFNAMAASGDYVYLTGDEFGVQIIDFSNPAKPQIHPGFRLSGHGQDIVVDNSLAFVAGGPSGVTVFDVSKPRHIQWLGSHNKMGAVHDVTVYQGIIAIVNNADDRLISLDVSNPQLPITDSIYKPQGRIHDLLVDWPYAYVASNRGIERVDFSSSAAVQISNEGINQGGSRRAFIRDDIAYVADWFSGLHMYDISIPYAPRHLGNFHTQGSSKGVVVRDNIAFVGDDDHGLQIIDISDPQHPQKISELLPEGLGLAYTMALVDNLLYLADHRGGFQIIDVSDVHHPKLLGDYDTPGKSWAIDVVDGIAYVADDSSGLLVFDVRDPGAIELIGQFNPGGYAEDVKVAGQQAYVAFFDKGFYILDISNPRKPEPIGHTPIPGNARSVSLKGAYAYIAGWESGLQVVDIRNVFAPKIVSYLDTDGSAWGVDVYKHHAYIWDWWGGVKVADISNPLQPRAVGRYHGRGLIRRLAIEGDYLYTANGAGGMQVYDIKNPLNPIWATGLDVSGSVQDINLAGDKAYLAAGDQGIVIADIGNPFYVHWLGRLKTPGRIQRLTGDQSRLIAWDERTGLLVVDVSRPEKPRITDRLAGHCNDLWLSKGRLYVSSPAKGLSVYAINKRLQLKPIAHFPTDGEARWVRTAGDYVFLSESGKGIHLLKWRDNVIEPVGLFSFTGTINDIQIHGRHLYAANESAGLLDIDIANPTAPTLGVVYPPTVVLESLAVNDHAVFVGGETSVNSVSRLGQIAIQNSGNGNFQLRLSENLPMGNYQFSLIRPDGTASVMQQTLSVKPAAPKKPKFTLEDFKKILKQQKLNKQNPP